MTNRYGKQLAEIATSTTAAQNADLLTTAFRQVRSDSKIRLTISVTAAVKVLLFSSDGGEALYLNGGAALAADSIHSEEFALDTTRSWNVQSDDVAGVTCELLSIVEVDR